MLNTNLFKLYMLCKNILVNYAESASLPNLKWWKNAKIFHCRESNMYLCLSNLVQIYIIQSLWFLLPPSPLVFMKVHYFLNYAWLASSVIPLFQILPILWYRLNPISDPLLHHKKLYQLSPLTPFLFIYLFFKYIKTWNQ